MARRTKAGAAGRTGAAGEAPFSARRMFAELASAPTRILTGLVKEDTSDPTTILFSSGPTCSEWVSIPEGMVRDYELVRVVRCGDHEHPLVHLHLRDPATPEERAYLLADSGRDLTRPVAMPASVAAAAAVPGLFRAPKIGLERDCVYDADLGWVVRGTRIPCPGA